MNSLIFVLDSRGYPIQTVVSVTTDAVVSAQNVRQRRRNTHTRYAGPVVVLGPDAPTDDQLEIRTKLAAVAASRRAPRRDPHSVLRPPRVVTPAALFVATPVEVVSIAPAVRVGRLRRPVDYRLAPPPEVFGPDPPTSQQVTLRTELAVLGTRRTPKRTYRSRLSPPTVVAPPAAFTGPATHVVQTRPRLPFSRLPLVIVTAAAAQTYSGPLVTLAKPTRRRGQGRLAPPTTLQVFTGPVANCLIPDRLARRHRRGINSFLLPPVVLATFAGPAVTRTRTRPRRTDYVLFGPATLEPASIQDAQRRVTVKTVRTRPRRTTIRLVPPTVVRVPSVEQAQQTIKMVLAGRTRIELGRRTGRNHLTAVSYPATSSIAVTLAVRSRTERLRRAPLSHLSPPVFYAATSSIRTQLVRTRPRPTLHFLTNVSYPQATVVGAEQLAVRTAPIDDRTRRLPRSRLSPPIFYAATSQIATHLVRTRPRRTVSYLRPPTALQVFSGPAVHLVATRPRPTHHALPAPTLVTYPPVVTTLAVTLAGRTRVDARRRSPHSLLGAPRFYAATSEILVALVRTRPQPTISSLTAVTYPQTGRVAEDEVFVHTTIDNRTRRQPHSFLSPPKFYAATSDIRVSLTRTRPRPTVAFLTSVRYPQTSLIVERLVAVKAPIDNRERRQPHSRLAPPVFYPSTSEIAVVLTRTRPRPTVSSLTAVTYPATSSIRVVLTRTRPRPTVHSLTAVSYEQATRIVEDQVFVFTVVDDRTRRLTHSHLSYVVYEATSPIAVTLAGRSRADLPRRAPHSFLRLPTVVRVPSVEQRQQTIAVTLVRSRPRPTVHRLTPPTVVRIPAVEQQQQTIRVYTVTTRPQPTTPKLAPPTVIVVNPPVDTSVDVHGVAVRTRAEQQRHRVQHVLRPPTVVVPLPDLAAQTIQTALQALPDRLARLRRRTRGRVFPPATLAVRAPQAAKRLAPSHRPARTMWRLAPPTVLKTFTAATVTLAPARRPITNSRLAPPAVVAAQTFVGARVTLVRARPRATLSTLAPPTVVTRASFFGPQVTLAPARRPSVRSTLRPPTVLRGHAGPRVTLTRTRPRAVTAFLTPPTVVAAAAPPTLAQQTLLRWLVRLSLPRRRPRTVLYPPGGTVTRKPGFGQITDVPGDHGTITDRPVSTGSLDETPGATGGAGDVAASGSSISDVPGATGGINDELS